VGLAALATPTCLLLLPPATPQVPPPLACCFDSNPGAPCWIGAWEAETYDLHISDGQEREIAHAALVPKLWRRGAALEGRVLAWTVLGPKSVDCKSYAWNPVSPGSAPLPIPFYSPCVPPSPIDPFCSGPMWTGDGKLIAAGAGTPNNDVFALDPGNATTDTYWDMANALFPDLNEEDFLYYPSTQIY
jgi:hypothetical protein